MHPLVHVTKCSYPLEACREKRESHMGREQRHDEAVPRAPERLDHRLFLKHQLAEAACVHTRGKLHERRTRAAATGLGPCHRVGKRRRTAVCGTRAR